jgi:hypothetical protein
VFHGGERKRALYIIYIYIYILLENLSVNQDFKSSILSNTYPTDNKEGFHVTLPEPIGLVVGARGTVSGQVKVYKTVHVKYRIPKIKMNKNN